MCGRYALLSRVELLVDLFRLAGGPALTPRFNIAPTQDAPVVRLAGGGDRSRRLDLLRWGLVPSWAKDPEIGGRMINARSETAAEKPAFREAFRHRRCLVPADAFYEWKHVGPGKQPYAIRRHDGAPFAMAGLWERWTARDAGAAIDSFSILTTTPNGLVETLHDRMPVIIDRERFDTWLDPDLDDAATLRSLMSPIDADRLAMYPVSRRVNTPANDDPECLEPIPDPERPEARDEPGQQRILF